MKELGKLKDRYEVSLDSRQFGLALFGAAALAALVFILGISVGLQWEKRKLAEAKALVPAAAAPAKAVPAVPPPPVAPPVYTPVTTAAAKQQVAPPPDAGKKDAPRSDAREITVEERKLDGLTFPKVLTSNNKNTAPLVPEKKAKTAGGSGYTIQVAAFNDDASARAKADKLRKKGYDAHVFKADKKGAYRFKVRVGSYGSKDAAASAAKRLKTGQKVAPYIVRE